MAFLITIVFGTPCGIFQLKTPTTTAFNEFVGISTTHTLIVPRRPFDVEDFVGSISTACIAVSLGFSNLGEFGHDEDMKALTFELSGPPVEVRSREGLDLLFGARDCVYYLFQEIDFTLLHLACFEDLGGLAFYQKAGF